MRTPSEFQKTFWSGFNNSDFGNDLEKHLTNMVDNGNALRLYYGTQDEEQFKRENDGDEIAEPHFIDIKDSSYFYANVEERNFDMLFFQKVVTEFRNEHKLSQKLIWI